MFQTTPFTYLSIITSLTAFVLLYAWFTYNSFIKKQIQVKTDYSDIDIQLKRRASLIDNLVELVKGYAKHEQDTFVNIAKARSALDTSKTPADMANADNMLSQTLRSLFLVVENYPKLQASENFKALQRELTVTEDLIAVYREDYNRSVQQYNTSIQTFPSLFIASLLGFKEEPFFQTT